MEHQTNFPIARAASLDEAAQLPEDPASGWTRTRQAEFLRQLAATQCVATAARSVGLSRQSAYKLRNRLRGEPFDIAWQCAFRRQFDTLAEVALDRAVNGTEVPHYYKGELVGTHRVYDGSLAIALLRMQQRLTPLPCTRHDEQSNYYSDNLEALVARVEQGGELWLRDEQDENADGR
jgi:hypothetical protein